MVLFLSIAGLALTPVAVLTCFRVEDLGLHNGPGLLSHT